MLKKMKKRNFFKNKGKCGDNSWTRALDAIHIINFIWPKRDFNTNGWNL